jgi:hypothetical protein
MSAVGATSNHAAASAVGPIYSGGGGGPTTTTTTAVLSPSNGAGANSIHDGLVLEDDHHRNGAGNRSAVGSGTTIN